MVAKTRNKAVSQTFCEDDPGPGKCECFHALQQSIQGWCTRGSMFRYLMTWCIRSVNTGACARHTTWLGRVGTDANVFRKNNKSVTYLRITWEHEHENMMSGVERHFRSPLIWTLTELLLRKRERGITKGAGALLSVITVRRQEASEAKRQTESRRNMTTAWFRLVDSEIKPLWTHKCLENGKQRN